MKRNFRYTKIFCFSVLISCFSFVAQASVMGVYPSATTANVGNIVPVKISVSTNGEVINNAESVVSYPTDLLEVTAISKTNSIFSLWVDEPTFSNVSGEVNFNGGLPSPGYQGNLGEVLTILFRTKKPGLANISLKNSAIRANDGLGTNVFKGGYNSSINILSGAKSTPAENEVVPSVKIPSKPVVNSPTHPDQNSWYQNKEVTFNWKTPSNVDYVKTLFNNKASSEPTVSYDNSVTERTINNVSDGIYYFHIKYVNDFGSSPTQHYKVQIDSIAPEKFNLSVIQVDGNNQVILDAKDNGSGIDHYQLTIDEQNSFRVNKTDLDLQNNYILPLQSKGKHTLKVVAYDFAQNHTESATTFFSSDISAPKIKVEDKQINRGDSIVISGTSDYPNTDVNIYLNIDTKDEKIYTVKSDSDGAFKIKTDKINKGDSVSINARVAISKDVLGAMSDTLTVYISDTSVVNTSKSIIYIMSFVVPALFMIIVAILMVYAGWYRFFGLRRRIKSEIKAVQTSVHKVMNEFRKELAEQLEYLQEKKEDRTITKKEEKIIAELKKNIDRVEEVIEKKIGEIK